MQDKPVTPLRVTVPICQISMLADCILRFLPDLRTWDLFVESEKEMKANLIILMVVVCHWERSKSKVLEIHPTHTHFLPHGF